MFSRFSRDTVSGASLWVEDNAYEEQQQSRSITAIVARCMLDILSSEYEKLMS